jgi:Holliday junction resolvasome RuvABC endonuclease subunit
MLFYQMTRILRQRQALKHDDRLDALAIAISYFVDKVNQDVKDAEEVHKVERRTAALERFLEAFDAGYSAHTSGADSIYNYFPRG